MASSGLELIGSAGWRVLRRSDGELVLSSPWSGASALLSRPGDVAYLLDASGMPASSGAFVACMLARLVSSVHR